MGGHSRRSVNHSSARAPCRRLQLLTPFAVSRKACLSRREEGAGHGTRRANDGFDSGVAGAWPLSGPRWDGTDGTGYTDMERAGVSGKSMGRPSDAVGMFLWSQRRRHGPMSKSGSSSGSRCGPSSLACCGLHPRDIADIIECLGECDTSIRGFAAASLGRACPSAHTSSLIPRGPASASDSRTT